MDAAVKVATVSLPVVQVTFLRFGLRGDGDRRGRRLDAPARAHLGDAADQTPCAGSSSWRRGLAFFTALSRLPLAEATALTFLAPSFMALFAAIFLRERPAARSLAALRDRVFGHAGDRVRARGLRLGRHARSDRRRGGARGGGVLRARHGAGARPRGDRRGGDHRRAPAPRPGPRARGAGGLGLAADDDGPRVAVSASSARSASAAISCWPAPSARPRPPASRRSTTRRSSGRRRWGFVLFGEVPGWATLAGAALIVTGAAVASRR